MALWLKGGEGLTIVNTDEVSVWADQSGNGNDLDDQLGTSIRPREDTVHPNLNNEAAVQFNTDDVIAVDWATGWNQSLNFSTGFELYIAIKPDSWPSTFSQITQVFTNGIGWNSGGFGIMWYNSNMRFWVNTWNTSTQHCEVQAIPTIQASIIHMRYNPAGSAGDIMVLDTYSATIPVTRTSVKISDTEDNYTGTVTIVNDTLEIGRGGSASYDFNGAIGEYILYDGPQSAQDRTATLDYLSTKFNIPLS
jgi:hypothetical protein